LLVVHAAEIEPERTVLDAAALRRRLGEEVARALEYGRELALVLLGVPAPAQALRAIDVVGMLDDGRTAVVLPELGGAAALAAAARRAGGGVAGLALCPADACDADGLLGGARAALAAAAPGCVRTVAATAERLELGGRTVLLAHPATLRVYELIRRLAPAPLPVLITGETGVGKEHAAFAVHHYSPRARGPYVALSCAAMPETLIESELFGHERGAFTGAAAAKAGMLETASGGTLFLDEVGELTAAA